MFKSVLENDMVKHNAKWDDIRMEYKNNQYFKDLHPYDRISTFIEYILEVEKKYDDELAK